VRFESRNVFISERPAKRRRIEANGEVEIQTVSTGETEKFGSRRLVSNNSFRGKIEIPLEESSSDFEALAKVPGVIQCFTLEGSLVAIRH